MMPAMTPPRLVTTWALVMMLGMPARVPAEPVVVVGSRVRLTLAEPNPRFVGIVTAVDERTVAVVSPEGGAFGVPLADITRVELSLGRRTNAVKGFLIGAAVGVVMGPALCDQCTSGERADAILAGLFTYSLVGGGIGFLVKTERWMDVAPPTAASLPKASLGVSLRF